MIDMQCQKDGGSLVVRTHRSHNCGFVLNRDYNAGLNILKKNLALLPQELREVTLVEILVRGSRKQEAMSFRVVVPSFVADPS